MPSLPARRTPISRPSLVRRLVVALGVIASVYLVTLAIASSDPVERRLRRAIDAALRARLGEVTVGAELHVDPLFRVWFGPIELPATRGGPPVVRVERAMARASFSALLGGRAEPATILLGGVRVSPGPDGRDLRDLVARLREVSPRGAAPGAPSGARDLPKLKLRGLVVAFPSGDEPVELGPVDADLRVDRSSDRPRLRAEASLPAGGRVAVAAELGSGRWRATLRARGLGAGALPSALRTRAGATISGGTLSLEVDADAPADLSRATASARLELEGLVLAGERIGTEPVGPLRASAAGRVEWDRARRRVVLRDGTATLLRAVTVDASGELAAGPPARFSLALRAERVDWPAALAALPPALALPPQAPCPAGTLDARLEVAGPLLSPADWKVSAALDLRALRERARLLGRGPLAEPFVHRPPLDAGGHGPELRVGPPSRDFVPIAELPEHVVRAVTASEDGGFFGHSGFDFDELRNAFAQGAERGRVVRGGSTISQQVAKNLFLGPERTLARKVREAAITVGLEASLPKRRLLEIYLNVAEWGPGLWGIGPAARHWFGKDARALSPKEAAFLASVIPNPVRYHVMFDRGAPSETWEGRVRALLFRMAEQGSLSEGQLVEALAQPVAFASPVSAAAATAEPDPGAAAPPRGRDP